jgi:hypothetical protein
VCYRPRNPGRAPGRRTDDKAMSQAADEELLARFQRLCGSSGSSSAEMSSPRLCGPAVAPAAPAAGRNDAVALATAGRNEAVAAPAADRKEAERLLQEMLEAEKAIATDDGPPCSFPSAPTAAVPEQQSTRPAAIALRAHAETLWCHICRLDAHVWCADCSDAPFCAKCWRETHTPAWTDPALRRHRTVPCTANRIEAALPAPPPNAAVAPAPARIVSSASSRLRAKVQQCQTCPAAAHVFCSDCDDSPFCARCWRDIHKLSSELLRHRTVRVAPRGGAC